MFKGGVGSGFKAPSSLEMSEDYLLVSCGGGCWLQGNTELKPETSVNYEAGLAYQTGDMGLGGTYFHNDVKDKIVRDTSTMVGVIDGLPVITYQNISKAQIKGVELDGFYRFTPNIGVDINYTYTDAKDVDTNEKIEQTPEHLANLKLNWRIVEPVNTFLRVNYVGEQVIGGNEVGGYSLVSLGADYTYKQVGVRAGIGNLFNTRLDKEAEEYGYVEKGRSVYANIFYNF